MNIQICWKTCFCYHSHW